jgi:hypothetical protein
MAIFRVIVLLSLVSALNGCVIAVNTDDWEDSAWFSRQHKNAERIEQLELGNLETDIRQDFGDPDFTESFARDGSQFVVLFYRTRHVDTDGTTTKNETTPLVFVDGTLVGWGDSAIENATGMN